ncbi:hypothetical protein G5S34_04600 [Herbaspirillum frisingense]|uniref:hypothetical protein n=1 Tax=Herbaspirillum frisingense TaxID=92645 RepID=UPI0016020308|nr:hypothetical protein [Herbaspirillum frisingense]QNB06120.1 hypothetical protein G5S34_04600 [Herbaspirillum frisingense]
MKTIYSKPEKCRTALNEELLGAIGKMNELNNLIGALADTFEVIHQELFRLESNEIEGIIRKMLETGEGAEITADQQFAIDSFRRLGAVEFIKRILWGSTLEDQRLAVVMRQDMPAVEVLARTYPRLLLNDARQTLVRIAEQ